jgi:hypothetical protein
MRRYWVPVDKSTQYEYDDVEHGVVIFVSNVPFLGPHPVLVNAIFRMDEAEVAALLSAASFGDDLCNLGRNLIRKDTNHFGCTGLSVGVGLHAFIGGKTPGTISSYGRYGPKDKERGDEFNVACVPVLEAAAKAEKALERRFGPGIFKATVQDCTDALHDATKDTAELLTVAPTPPMQHWLGTTIGRGVKSLVHRDRDSTWTYLVTPLQDDGEDYAEANERATFNFSELQWRVPFKPGVCF